METVRYEARDHIAYVTLARSAARNAIDESVLTGLEVAIGHVRAATDVTALVLTGSGDAFCIGLDIGLLERAFADTSYFRDVLERFKRILLDLEGLDVPVIAAVNGLARAGGFELILASDLAIAADEARIADHHLAFGIPPGGGATQRAPRRLGAQRAREMLYTARWVSGHEAASIGLVLRSVPRAGLDAAVEALCAELRDKSRTALAVTKHLIREGAPLRIEDAVQLEIDRFIEFLDEDPTSREGFNAYVDRSR